MDFKLIPISQDASEWQCALLKLGGLTILLNCGLSEALETRCLEPLLPFLSELDLILLTHSDVKHLGGIPYLLSKYDLTCPVLCTEPVCRLGELSCVSCLEDREKYREPSDSCEVDDVLRIFMSRLTPLNFREPYTLQARGRALVVCPYPAGGQLGGTFWTLQSSSASIVYLVDFELRQGRCLDGLELQRLLPSCRGTTQRWDALITAPLPHIGLPLPQLGALKAPQEVYAASKALMAARNIREQVLIDETIAALRRGGTVLIPADVAGWIPEALLLFEAAWAQDRQLAQHYPLVWLSSMGDMVLDQVKTRLEYMSKEVLATFEAKSGQNPFVLKNVRIFQTLEELVSTHPLSRPKVILTTSPFLEGGDSRELFLRLATEPKTLLWLLGVPPQRCLARSLLEDFVLGNVSRKSYRLLHYTKQALPDDELRAYYESMVLPQAGEKDEPEDAAPPAPGLIKTKTEAEEPAGTGAPVQAPAPPARPAPKDTSQRSGAGALWSPLGWPSSRTLAHSEWRVEGDEYGHLLLPAEIRAWKAQDQGATKQGGPGAAGLSLAEAAAEAAIKAKEEALAEEEAMGVTSESKAEWREALRLHFREPMRYDAREKTVRVACRVRYLPDSTVTSQDLNTLLQLISPKHVVLLPAAESAATQEILTQTIANSHFLKASGAPPPQVHTVSAKEDAQPLTLSLQNLKRKLQVSQNLLPKLSFQKTADGVRIARIRAVTNPAADGRSTELVAIDPAEPALEDKAPSAPSQQPRLPRSSGMFVGLGSEGVRLSGLKDALRTAEWNSNDVEVEFRPPSGESRRPWSSRVLSVGGGKAALGWAGLREGGLEGGRGQVPVIRLEGVPSEEFFRARAALYKRCAVL